MLDRLPHLLRVQCSVLTHTSLWLLFLMFFVWIFFFWEDSESTGGSSCGGARPRRGYELCDRGSFGDRSLRMGLDFIFLVGMTYMGEREDQKKSDSGEPAGIFVKESTQPTLRSLGGRDLIFSFKFLFFIQSINQKGRF